MTDFQVLTFLIVYTATSPTVAETRGVFLCAVHLHSAITRTDLLSKLVLHFLQVSFTRILQLYEQEKIALV